jgi:hypothetical protein
MKNIIHTMRLRSNFFDMEENIFCFRNNVCFDRFHKKYSNDITIMTNMIFRHKTMKGTSKTVID